ncbi:MULTISPECIES: hypothetical protein [Actinomycetes]|uniref:hypothetical protein n=1 Tax=Micromonospora sp. NPDC005367 TaxID=3155590 RepID=UPI00339F4157
MPIAGIASAKHKLRRALLHIDDLDGQIQSYHTDNPVDVEIRTTDRYGWPEAMECEVVVINDPPSEVPDEWGLVAGDALTNMRAALDHAVHPHSWNFPTIIKKIEEGSSPLGCIYSDAVTAIIESHQPRNVDVPRLHPLGMLCELVNTDKHRQLLVANHVSARLNVQQTGEFEVTEQEDFRKDDLRRGDVICKFRVKPVNAEAEKVTLTYRYRLDASPIIDIPETSEYRPIVPTLRAIHEEVGVILDELDTAGMP